MLEKNLSVIHCTTQQIITSGLPFHQMFEAQAQKFPDSIAVRFNAASIKYSELNNRANQLARHLKAIGVATDVVVGLHISCSIDTIIAMIAILKAGGTYVPLDPSYPQERLIYMLEDTRLSILITKEDEQTGLLDALNLQTITPVFLDTDAVIISKQSHKNLDTNVSPVDLMYIIYTSGSMGKPKGVMVSHANVTRLFAATQAHLRFDEYDVWTLFHSYSFGFSVWEIWGALVHGGTLVIVPPSVRQNPDSFHYLVYKENITVLSQTPSAFSLFQLSDTTSGHSDDSVLRYIVFSGESSDPEVLKRWIQKRGDEQPQLINMYAITETAGEITYRRIRQTELSDNERNNIGIPLPDVRIYLLDGNQRPVPRGETGEMYIGSTAVAQGYLNLSELTQQRFLSDPFQSENNARMYKTGDRARCLPNGEIEFLGRADEQVKIRGYRVEPVEIQQLLIQHQKIREAIVVTQLSSNSTPILVAYFVPKAEPLTTEELKHYLKATLPDYMIPGRFIALDRLPRSINGKIDRQALSLAEDRVVEKAKGYVAQTAEEEALAALWKLNASPEPINILSGGSTNKPDLSAALPQTAVEKSLAVIWSEVLNQPMITLDDSFFELGGNSLLAAQIIYQINDVFNVSLSMRELMDNSSINELSVIIAERQSSTDELDDILEGLAELSDEEAQQLLFESMNESDASVETERKEANTLGNLACQDETYMRMAIEQARAAIENGQNPIAACVVKDGMIVASEYNQVSQQTDITAHAELLALRSACKQLNSLDLSGCVLYITLEPCPMCFSASQWAGIDKIVFGARRDDAIKFGLGNESVHVHTMKELTDSSIELVEDCLRDENLSLLKTWLNEKNYTQYDGIAKQFQQIKDSPINRHVVDYTFFNLINNLGDNKKILDLACGEGSVCRQLKQRGARHVVGVDISSAMISLARQKEKNESPAIEYICQDILALGKIGDFDLVVASFLLNYAKTEAQLVKMCQVAFDNLNSGGCFILINENFEQLPDKFQGYERYGYTKKITEPWQDGSVITYTISDGDNEFDFNGYYWGKDIYQSAFKIAGFNKVELYGLSCSPQGINEYGSAFWQNLIDNPPFIGIIARK
ncbi:amino acid adenylation domain-containing protein [Oceanospirillum sediminis]|uniref:Amino acid adenylation domain-containing protein n=1 Tax=Oceanospirillum sediminis TaxID=2760088 RepID=A0A839IUI4_9GAMM|nr:amino acid adenylation domain-containing protein [Oceanospirillum sediminis]MBB1488601.1 amino acid adenylation domain-containing protein [Oceanospirillum sediminis]